MNLYVGTHKHLTEEYAAGHERTFGERERQPGRRRYKFDEESGKMVEVSPEWEGRKPGLQIIQDIDVQGRSYQSPVSLKMITSRRAMREDLKATGCRQVDPSERDNFLNRS